MRLFPRFDVPPGTNINMIQMNFNQGVGEFDRSSTTWLESPTKLNRTSRASFPGVITSELLLNTASPSMA